MIELDAAMQTKMLTDACTVFFENQGAGMMLDPWVEDVEVGRETVYYNAEDLAEKNVVQFTQPGVIQPTARGILFAEEKGLVPPEQVARNSQARTKILSVLAQVREEQGVNGWAPYQWVMETAELDANLFHSNQEVLLGLGMLEWPATQLMTITKAGMNSVREWRKRTARAEAYQQLASRADLTPQQRGHELEALLKIVIEEDGWQSEANVRAAGEENDLIIHQNREYYIIQCKWEKHAVQSHYLSVLRDRVSSRAGVRGLFFSVSGYSEEAIQDAIHRLEGTMMLLFGPGDLAALMSHSATFSSLLDAKFHAAVLRREIAVDGKNYRR